MTTETRLSVGAQAPDIELKTSAGESAGLASLWSEKPLALIFFHDLANQFAVELAIQWRDGGGGVGEAGGVVVGVCWANPHAVKTFVERWGLQYPLLSDATGRAYAAFHVSPELPGAFVIDTGGAVRYAHRNAEPLDSPPTWSLIDMVSSITGQTVTRPQLTVVGEDDDELDLPPGVPAPGQRDALNYTCVKCQNQTYDVVDVSTTSGMLSRMVNLQNRRFSAVVCQNCRYVEFYQTQSGALRNVADLLVGS